MALPPNERLDKLYGKLKKLRERTDLSLPSSKHLRDTFLDIDGNERKLTVRYYQVQMAIHLAAMKRFVVGDDTGLGKTLEIIAALCLIWEKTPQIPAIILTTKSSAPQWVDEFNKFTEGVQAFLYEGTKTKNSKGVVRDRRGEVWEAFLAAEDPKVLVMNYKKAWQDFGRFQDYKGYILITDEATAYKTITSQTHQVVCHLANNSERVWAATATLIKNNLVEGYSIYRVVVPGLFDNRVTQFQTHYCITETVMIGRGRRVPKVIGYEPERIAEFKATIDPFYLGRPKHDVADELPALIQKNIEIPMSKAQEAKYTEIMTGMVTIGEGNDTLYEEREVSKLTALIYYQQAVNHLELLNCEGPSTKLNRLLELLTEDFEGENVIIFTRFKSMVDLMVPAIEKALSTSKKDKTQRVVRVTGDENSKQRNESKKRFQAAASPVRVICITSAGGEAINLQSAKAIIFFDTPWSAGEYLQVLGRMIRIGSIHDRCYAIHLVSRRHESKRAWKTIDHQVIEVLNKKMELVEAVLGERIKGTTESDEIRIIDATPEVSLIYASLENEARAEAGLKPKKRKTTPKARKKGPAQEKTQKSTALLAAFADDDEDLDSLFED